MNARFLRIIIALTVCILLSFSFSLSHSGNTNSEGGHNDYHNVSGLGPYHYHHGHSAHLHENGICPYEQEVEYGSGVTCDQEGKNKNSSLYWLLIALVLLVILCSFTLKIVLLCKSKKANKEEGFVSSAERKEANKGGVNKTFLIIILSVFLSISILLNISLIYQNQNITQENQRLKSESSILNEKSSEFSEYESKTEALFVNILPQYLLYRNYAVFVAEHGAKYHKADCFHIKNKDFLIYNIDAATDAGYTPCSDCWEHEDFKTVLDKVSEEN